MSMAMIMKNAACAALSSFQFISYWFFTCQCCLSVFQLVTKYHEALRVTVSLVTVLPYLSVITQ